MLAYWRKNTIDNYIANLAEYYRDCSLPYFSLKPVVETLTAEEKDYLNENLHLERIVAAEKGRILHKLLEEPEKANFTKHVFCALNIILDVNGVDEKGWSLFQLLLDRVESNDYEFRRHLQTLYKRGYFGKSGDEGFLKDYFHTKLKSEDHLEYWCLARICAKLNDAEKIEKAMSIEGVLFSIISFKQKKPVGYRYANLLAVANNALQHYREYGELLLRSMREYKVYDKIKLLDKKGTFAAKEKAILSEGVIQNQDLLPIIFEVFPELKQETSVAYLGSG